MLDYNNTKPEIKKQIAATAIATLEKLALDKDESVRAEVAANINTSLQVLESLTSDFSVLVNKALSRNPNASPEILARFINNAYWELYKEVARHPNTSSETLEELATYNDRTVRNAVMKHPNVSSIAIAIAQFMDGKKDIPVDADAYGPHSLDSNSSIPRPQGGGGTSFVPFFVKVDENWDRQTQGVCVYLTDGYGTFPNSVPELPVLWVVTPGGLDLSQFPYGEAVRLLEY